MTCAKSERIFWDVGGVLLTDAWDHAQRAEALAHFGLDQTNFRHATKCWSRPSNVANSAWMNISTELFFTATALSPAQAFRDYMFSLSKPKPDVLALARELAKSGKYQMSTINNESLDLNLYRIQTFGLARDFQPVREFLLCGIAQAGRRHLPAGPAADAEITGEMLFSGRSPVESGIRSSRWECMRFGCENARAVAGGTGKAGSDRVKA